MLTHPIATFLLALAAIIIVMAVVVKPAFDTWEINHSFPYNECNMRRNCP